ncbi:MAG: GxxExxY protein, partial [Planctomycetota bacterium]
HEKIWLVGYPRLAPTAQFGTTEVDVSIEYEGIRFDEGYRVDLLVENKVIVEIKSIERITGVHKKQLPAYLRLMDKQLGLLINFNEELIHNGISRVVNGLEENWSDDFCDLATLRETFT